jgi:uncharacterized protein involved in exopolysaccharide biosynthesis
MSINNQLDEIIDFKQFFSKILRSWSFFAISLFLALAIAIIYNRYTPELYKIDTSLMINEDNTIVNAADLLYENPLKNNSINLENKALILKSYPLVYSTLKELEFDISYHTIGNIKISETHIAPIRVESENAALLKGKSIIVECIDDKQFILIDEASEKQVIYNFGEEINFYDAKIIIDLNVQYFSIDKKYQSTLVIFKDLTKLTQTYQNKILVAQEDKNQLSLTSQY